MTLTASEMLAKLNELYDRKEHLQDDVSGKLLELEQVEEDIDLLQTFIMAASNRFSRAKEIESKRQQVKDRMDRIDGNTH